MNEVFSKTPSVDLHLHIATETQTHIHKEDRRGGRKGEKKKERKKGWRWETGRTKPPNRRPWYRKISPKYVST